jgi:hypothetical protein
MNWWDIANKAPRDTTAAITAVKNGYAYVLMQERGQFWSEGLWDVLGWVRLVRSAPRRSRSPGVERRIVRVVLATTASCHLLGDGWLLFRFFTASAFGHPWRRDCAGSILNTRRAGT